MKKHLILACFGLVLPFNLSQLWRKRLVGLF
jgi:hypothetical protein